MTAQEIDSRLTWPAEDAVPGTEELDRLLAGAERLAGILRGSSVGRVSLSVGAVRLEVEAVAPPAVQVAAPVAGAPVAGTPIAGIPVAGVPVAAAPAAPAEPAPPPGFAVTAPLVGVFYRSAGPGKAPFVEVGDRVAAGDQIGIVEAMKMMNEVLADRAGVVREIHPADAEVVEFGQVLFTLSPE